jgi:secretion/DNA translocation related TadE-like protein
VNGDRGSVTVWLASACALVLLAATTGALRGLAVLGRHRAEAAADLAALAAAGQLGTASGDPSPCSLARTVAAGNRAAVLACRVAPSADGRSGVVDVVVAASIGLPVLGRVDVRASARAGRLAVKASTATVAPGPPSPGRCHRGSASSGCGMLARGDPRERPLPKPRGDDNRKVSARGGFGQANRRHPRRRRSGER